MRPSLLVKVLIGCAVLYGCVLLFVGRGLLDVSLYPDYNDARRMAIRNIQPLIDLGLVVPRWNDEPEVPAVAGGPGEERTKFITSFVLTCSNNVATYRHTTEDNAHLIRWWL
jgi:hypothetical protein